MGVKKQMRQLNIISFFILFTLILTAGSAHTQADIFVGERLVYEFGWKGFTAAQAEISIGEMTYNGVDSYKLEIMLKSLARLDWIWKVRDRMVSWAAKKDLTCQRFFYEQREGKFYLDTTIELDKSDNILRSTRIRYKDGKEKEYTPKWANADHLDPVAALLHLRKQKMEVGGAYSLKVFDGKRRHTIQYKVVGKETIETDFGPKECFKIHPKILKSDKAKADSIQAEKVEKVTVWATASPEHTVMRIESKAWIGSVYAKLVKNNR